VGIINETETQHDYRILPITDVRRSAVRVIFHVGYWMYFHATVLLGSTMIFMSGAVAVSRAVRWLEDNVSYIANIRFTAAVFITALISAVAARRRRSSSSDLQLP